MKNTVWYLPIEPLEQRYTKDWLIQFPEVFREKYIVKTIIGQHRKHKLNNKFFLDPTNTNIWKFTQLKNLIVQFKKIRTGDIIFVADGWYPGIEALAYIRDMYKLKFKIISYFHAGTYDKWDLTTQCKMNYWAKKLEESWFKIYDIIFVATQFHKDLIIKNRNINPNKIIVVGFPIDIKNIIKTYRRGNKGKGIYFTGRKTIEKGYPLIEELRKKVPITISLDVTKTKDEYYKLMNKHAYIIAPSEQETFGIGVIEGMALGLTPIVPNKLAFKETVPSNYRYTTEQISMYITFLNKFIIKNKKTFRHIYKYQYENVIRNMMRYF